MQPESAYLVVLASAVGLARLVVAHDDGPGAIIREGILRPTLLRLERGLARAWPERLRVTAPAETSSINEAEHVPRRVVRMPVDQLLACPECLAFWMGAGAGTSAWLAGVLPGWVAATVPVVSMPAAAAFQRILVLGLGSPAGLIRTESVGGGCKQRRM